MEKRCRANKLAIQRGQIAFVGMIVVVTVLIGATLLKALRRGQPWSMGDTVIILLAILLDLICIGTSLSNGTHLVRWLTRASEIYRGGFPEVQDAVENVSIASGLPVPKLLFIDSCMRNAFSLSQRGQATIFFSHGLASSLDKDELQAVIAHEMAHINNGDADLNSALVSLRGFGRGDLQLRARVNTSSRWGDIAAAFLPRFIALGMIGMVVVSTLLAIVAIRAGHPVSAWIRGPIVIASLLAANFICAALAASILHGLADPNRELAADEMAIHWTFDPESLISALRKAEEDSYDTRLRLLFDMGFARFERTDPLPDAGDRIQALGETQDMPLEA